MEYPDRFANSTKHIQSINELEVLCSCIPNMDMMMCWGTWPEDEVLYIYIYIYSAC